MTTGSSAAKRDAKEQRRLLSLQRAESQKALNEEKSLLASQDKALKASQAGRGSLLKQQEGVTSLLGAMGKIGVKSGGGDGLSLSGKSAGGFIDPTSVGKRVDPIKKAQEIVDANATTAGIKRAGRSAGKALRIGGGR